MESYKVAGKRNFHAIYPSAENLTSPPLKLSKTTVKWVREWV